MRKIVLNAALLLFSKGYCQNQDSIPKIIFGFDLGLNYVTIQMKNVDPGVMSSNTLGFRMGLLIDYKLTKRLSFSPKTQLSFGDANLTLQKNPDSQEIYEVYPALLEFGLHANYKLNNHKTVPYVLFGPSYKVPLTGNDKVQYATKLSSLGLDFGIGLDKKLKFFNIAPELRYSLGLMNLSDINNVGELYYHSATLVFIFKG